MKIRLAMLANGLTINGISNVVINYCKNLDQRIFDITILAGKPVDEYYKKQFNELGIRLIELPIRHKNTIAYYSALYIIMKKEHFNILHVHGNSVNSLVELAIGYRWGVRVRIFHCHNSICNNPTLHKILRPTFRKLCTDRFACGRKAGEWIFDQDDFSVITNGFETEKFKFDNTKRFKVRYDLGISDYFVIGHIGRLNNQKNQLYLLKVFESVANKNDKAVLLLVGTGPYLDIMKEAINMHPYKERIILYGETNDTPAMYAEIDVFVLPSRFEGLPVVLLEAQISGVKCIASNRVTKEMDFGKIEWLSIDEKPELWSDAILQVEISLKDRECFYDNNLELIEKYQIKKNVKKLELLYMNQYEREYIRK